MISPKYRILATDPTYLDDFTKMMMFVLKFTRTTKVRGGRGSYFLNLVTESILRYIQLAISKVLNKFLLTTLDKNKDPDELILQNLLDENKFLSMHAFYKFSGDYNDRNDCLFVTDVPEVSMEQSPWDWFEKYFPEMNIFENDCNNLVTEKWYLQAFQVVKDSDSEMDINTAWKGGKLTRHAPSRIARFIQQGLKPHQRTCYFLLAVYHEIGFNIPLLESELFVHDIIGSRLEAFCRLYIGTVLQEYIIYDEKSKQCPNRAAIRLALSDNSKGIVFHRGNHNASKYHRVDIDTDKAPTEGIL